MASFQPATGIGQITATTDGANAVMAVVGTQSFQLTNTDAANTVFVNIDTDPAIVVAPRSQAYLTTLSRVAPGTVTVTAVADTGTATVYVVSGTAL